jgi:hypothetical protein
MGRLDLKAIPWWASLLLFPVITSLITGLLIVFAQARAESRTKFDDVYNVLVRLFMELLIHRDKPESEAQLNAQIGVQQVILRRIITQWNAHRIPFVEKAKDYHQVQFDAQAEGTNQYAVYAFKNPVISGQAVLSALMIFDRLAPQFMEMISPQLMDAVAKYFSQKPKEGA